MLLVQLLANIVGTLVWCGMMMFLLLLLFKLRSGKKQTPKSDKLSEQLLKEIGTMHRIGRSGRVGYTLLERSGDQETWASLFEVDSSWAREDERIKWERRQKVWMWLLFVLSFLLVLSWAM